MFAVAEGHPYDEVRPIDVGLRSVYQDSNTVVKQPAVSQASPRPGESCRE